MNNISFANMIDKYRSDLNRCAVQFTKDEDDAADLLQETMIKAVRFFNSYREGTNLRAWLFVIMKNTFFNSYQKAKRRQGTVVQEDEITYDHLLYSSTVNKAEGNLAIQDIYKALGHLPLHLSIPFTRYVEGYKYQEIADELQLPLGTVKTYIHEARKLLKKYLSMYK